VQSFHVENVDIRDMFQDIAIEEFSHLEMVGKLIAQHTSELDQTSLHDAPLLKLKAAAPTSGQPKAALAQQPTSKRVAMSSTLTTKAIKPAHQGQERSVLALRRLPPSRPPEAA
jgi:Mn-containing catalase